MEMTGYGEPDDDGGSVVMSVRSRLYQSMRLRCDLFTRSKVQRCASSVQPERAVQQASDQPESVVV